MTFLIEQYLFIILLMKKKKKIEILNSVFERKNIKYCKETVKTVIL